MGAVITRFRKKQTTVEKLESLEKEIASLLKFRQQNKEKQKKLVASLLLYSILVYIIGALIFFFAYFPEQWKFRLLYSIPLLVFPLLIFGIKKLLHWYFVKRITNNDTELAELREKKKQILEDVMEQETYKKAKEILEKFDPARFKQLEKPPTPTTVQTTPGSALRQRSLQQRMPTPSSGAPMMGPRAPMMSPRAPMSTPHVRSQRGPVPQRLIMSAQNGRPSPMNYSIPPGPPLPRPLLARDRSNFDKFVDYLVGDGPENRYALICKYCHSHNGMALKEEFEYLSFQCCYCYSMNPARKNRPYAPKLELPVPSSSKPSQHTDAQSKDDEENDYEDDEDDEDDEDGEEEDESDHEQGGGDTDVNKVVAVGMVRKSGEDSDVANVNSSNMGSNVVKLEKQSLDHEIPFIDGETDKQPTGSEIPIIDGETDKQSTDHDVPIVDGETDKLDDKS